MGIQDRDYWRERYNKQSSESSSGRGSSTTPPAGRRFRVIDEVRYPSSKPVESHAPERVLGILTVISALFAVAFISYQARIERAEKQAQQDAAQHAIQASMARAAEAKARAVVQAELQARVHAEQLEQKMRLQEKRNKDAEQKILRDVTWKRFYRPSAQCQADWTVECANTLIRARNAFAVRHGD